MGVLIDNKTFVCLFVNADNRNVPQNISADTQTLNVDDEHASQNVNLNTQTSIMNNRPVLQSVNVQTSNVRAGFNSKQSDSRSHKMSFEKRHVDFNCHVITTDLRHTHFGKVNSWESWMNFLQLLLKN